MVKFHLLDMSKTGLFYSSWEDDMTARALHFTFVQQFVCDRSGVKYKD